MRLEIFRHTFCPTVLVSALEVGTEPTFAKECGFESGSVGKVAPQSLSSGGARRQRRSSASRLDAKKMTPSVA
jgi:hypothetical protein